jgi:diguanylate cyclase (GGDEF)-like protein
VNLIKPTEINQSFQTIKERITKRYRDHSTVLDECAVTNTRRLYYLTIISIPLRIIDIYVFINNHYYSTGVHKLWSRGIIGSHLALLIFMIVFAIITYKLKDRESSNAAMHVIQYLSIFIIIASGIAIVTFDQLITTNITPFLIACTVIGLVFLIRPLISFFIYAAAYIAYYNLIVLYISDQQILLSNRVNGATAIGLGFLLNIIIWHYNYTNIIQKRHIDMQQKQLEQMAYHDSLTELPNRRLFSKLFQKEFSLMKRHGHESAMAILDVDNFKDVNDSYGHPVGDNVLRQLADLLKNNVRESDTVSRFGGEEFIILLPKTSLEEAYELAERLRKTITNHTFTVESDTFQLTSSFGICLLDENNSQSLDECYFLADKALYFAKQLGKNKVVTTREICSPLVRCD